MKSKIIFSVFVAILMVTTVASVFAPDDSDALTGNSNMSLNSDRAIIYVASGDNHSFEFTASFTDMTAGTISWKLNDLDDGTTLVSFSDTASTYTATGTSVTVYGKAVGSIEIEAYLASDEVNYHASAVIVVLQSATTSTEVFHFWFQVDADAEEYVPLRGTINNSLSAWETGFWKTVTVTDVQNEFGSDTEFNARNALQYLVDTTAGWSISFSSYGWINSFMEMGTYSSGSTYYYWAQYHCGAGDGSWAFNSTTLDFITTQDQCYIGMVFWGSPSSSAMPDLPSLPE